MPNYSRRTFLQHTAAVGAAAALPARSLLAASANEQVNLGVVGCGWRGQTLLKHFQRATGANIAGLCDVDSELLAKVGDEYPQAQRWSDLRGMFDSPDIDAVIVATCNHWHCLATIWAMQAGKHVYVEKPLGHAQWEGDQVVHASKRYNLVCQVGTQQRSDPMQAEIKQFLHEDKAIGEIQSVRVNRIGQRQPIGLRSEPLAVPSTIDYDLWLGPAQDQPIYRNKFHYDWHWVWNTGSGEMGNWGVHIIDDVRNNVFLDQVAMPRSIAAAGGRVAWNDAGNTPNVHFAVLDAGGIPVVVTLTNLPVDRESIEIPGPGSGYIVYGSEGALHGQRGSAVAYDPSGKVTKQFRGDNGDDRHQQNFIDAIRATKPSMVAAPARIGNDSTGWCNLINIASRVTPSDSSATLDDLPSQLGPTTTEQVLRQLAEVVSASDAESATDALALGPMLQYDSSTQRFVGPQAEQAGALLRRDDRPAYAVPEISPA